MVGLAAIYIMPHLEPDQMKSTFSYAVPEGRAPLDLAQRGTMSSRQSGTYGFSARVKSRFRFAEHPASHGNFRMRSRAVPTRP